MKKDISNEEKASDNLVRDLDIVMNLKNSIFNKLNLRYACSPLNLHKRPIAPPEKASFLAGRGVTISRYTKIFRDLK